MADVNLSAAIRSNLLSLQATSSLIDRTQKRLSTGLAISSPVDDAIKFFASKSLGDRATDLARRKDGIDQGISSLTTAVEASTSLEDLVDQMKGIVDSARSGTKEQRKEFQIQINELVDQVQNLVDDASYQGLNLLNSTSATLTVRFSEKSGSKIDVAGVNFNTEAFFLNSQGTAALGVSAGQANASAVITFFGFVAQLSSFSLSLATGLASFNEQANVAVGGFEKTVDNLRAKSANIANNIAILQVRLDFTEQYVNVLQDGADKLRLADLNEEGANLLALQTRQQLGIQSLAFAGQSEQSILALFG
jgi:flagellin-like hook-associated protein FlgL